jgi:hypothetical protein
LQCSSTMIYYAATGPKEKNQATSEIMNQNKPFLLLGWLSQVFHHSNRKLTNTFYCVLHSSNRCLISAQSTCPKEWWTPNQPRTGYSKMEFIHTTCQWLVLELRFKATSPDLPLAVVIGHGMEQGLNWPNQVLGWNVFLL